MKSATGKWTRNGWTLGSDENIENRARSLLRSRTRRQVIRRLPKGGEDRGPGAVVERKARPNEIASTEIASHHARVGVREIRGDPMDQLMHHHPPQRFREALPVGRLHHVVSLGGDAQYPGHAMVEDVNRARLGTRQIDAHRRWGEMPSGARGLGGRHDDHAIPRCELPAGVTRSDL